MLTPELFHQLEQLPEQERERLIRAGLYEAAQARIRELQEEIAICEAHIQTYQQRYGGSLQEFEETILAEEDSFALHEDYNDWFYWEQVLAEKKRLLSELEHVEEA